MIQIIIEGNSGELRIDSEVLDMLTDEEIETLRMIGNKLKEAARNGRV